MFFEGYTEKLWGRHPKEISAEWGAQRVKGISIFAVLKDSLSKVFHINSKKKETSLIEEYLYPKFGPGQLWEKVGDEFEKMGGKILKNYNVVKVNEKNGKIISVVCNVNGEEIVIKGDIFISSMPIKDLINGMEKVPNKVKQIANGLPYRDFITVGLLVKKLNLKNETHMWSPTLVVNSDIPTNSIVTTKAQYSIIPAKTYKVIHGFKISDIIYKECGNNKMNYPEEQSETINYTKSSSPLTFSNKLTYKIDGQESCIYLQNDFWICSLANYPEEEILENITLENCDDPLVKTTIEVNKKQAPNRFYNIYEGVYTSNPIQKTPIFGE
jgi:hypothetical protein